MFFYSITQTEKVTFYLHSQT